MCVCSSQCVWSDWIGGDGVSEEWVSVASVVAVVF